MRALGLIEQETQARQALPAYQALTREREHLEMGIARYKGLLAEQRSDKETLQDALRLQQAALASKQTRATRLRQEIESAKNAKLELIYQNKARSRGSFERVAFEKSQIKPCPNFLLTIGSERRGLDSLNSSFVDDRTTRSYRTVNSSRCSEA